MTKLRAANPAGLPAPLPAPGTAVVSLRRIDGADAEFAALVDLLVRNPRYWLETRGTMPTRTQVAALLLALPAAAAQADKFLWSVWCGGERVGCLDVVRRWPERHQLSIGLLMVDEYRRRRRIGTGALKRLAAVARPWAGVRRWRVAVIASQSDALGFWRRAGFMVTGQRQHAADELAERIVMEKPVGR